MSDKITTKCPHCNQKMKVRKVYLGKKIRCPKCEDAFKIVKQYPDEEDNIHDEVTFNQDMKKDAPYTAYMTDYEKEDLGTTPLPVTGKTAQRNFEQVNKNIEEHSNEKELYSDSIENWQDEAVSDSTAEKLLEESLFSQDRIIEQAELHKIAEDLNNVPEIVEEHKEMEDNKNNFDNTEQPVEQIVETDQEDKQRSYWSSLRHNTEDNMDSSEDTPEPAIQPVQTPKHSTNPESNPAPRPYSVEAEGKNYKLPKLKVFADLVPESAYVIKEYNLGVSGLIIPQSTKVCLTDNEVFVYTSRRFLFGIFPGGSKLGAYPLEFKELRAAVLKIPSLFAAFVTVILGIVVSLLGWYLQLKELSEEVFELRHLFDVNVLFQEEAMLQHWYLYIPFVIGLIWVFVFWRVRYKTKLFNVSISRWKKAEAKECIRLIHEQALRFEKEYRIK